MKRRWFVQVRCIQTPEKGEKGVELVYEKTEMVSQQALDDSLGRDVLVIQFHAAKCFSEVKEVLDES